MASLAYSGRHLNQMPFNTTQEEVETRSAPAARNKQPAQTVDEQRRMESGRLADSPKQPRIALYGHFSGGNFGNDSTFQAMLHHVRLLLPDAKLTCISTFPEKIAADYNIPAIPINEVVLDGWEPQNLFLRVVRKLFIGIPSEVYRWLKDLTTLRDTDMLIVVGTGLLNDAYGLKGWGPYSLLRWSVAAKATRCKLLFVSVGAGPLDTRLGRWFVKTSLALANFRSYRDKETKEYLSSIGVKVASDKVYPDLAFSIADQTISNPARSRRVVGLGLMLYHSKLTSDRAGSSTYADHLEQLAIFAQWLLANDYDIRLLTGDMSDRSVIEEFKSILRKRLDSYSMDRVFDEPIDSFENLLRQLGKTDFVVATRFHNILWALALNKPVISISFHQKCTSLMNDMGLKDYCEDIRCLSSDNLIRQFLRLEQNAVGIMSMVGPKVAECRKALDEQYSLIFSDFLQTGAAREAETR
jgi:polysaccharide pyruvyl transferase WcaK-like protein